MRQALHDLMALAQRGVLTSQRGERAPRPHLEEHAVRGVQQGRQRVPEAHSAAHVRGPVRRVGQLAGSCPCAGGVGEHGNRRVAQLRPDEFVPERGDDRVDQRGVGRRGDVETSDVDPFADKLIMQTLDGGGRPRHHRLRRSVDHRQREVVGQERDDVGLGERDRQHGAGRQAVEQLPAPDDELHRLGKGEDAGHARRGVRAEAVANDRSGRDAQAHPELRQRVLHDEHRRLADAHATKLGRRLLGGRGVAATRVEHAAQIEPEVGHGQVASLVDVLAERGIGLVQLAAHADVLPALSREHEDDRPLAGLARGRDHPGRVGRGQRARRVVGGVRDDDPAVDVCLATGLERPGDVGQRHLRVAPEVFGEPGSCLLQRGARTRRQRQQVARPGRLGKTRRRLLEDHVGIGAADPEGAHPGPPREVDRLPLRQHGVDLERAGLELELRVRPLEVQRGWDQAVLDGEDRLDEPGHTCGRVGVADVGLHRTQQGEADAVGALPERLRQRRHLDGVTERGRGAVRLDVA